MNTGVARTDVVPDSFSQLSQRPQVIHSHNAGAHTVNGRVQRDCQGDARLRCNAGYQRSKAAGADGDTAPGQPISLRVCEDADGAGDGSPVVQGLSLPHEDNIAHGAGKKRIWRY